MWRGDDLWRRQTSWSAIRQAIPVDVDRPLARALRAEVIKLRADWARRRPPAVLHAGFPGGRLISFGPVEEDADHGLRTDIAATLIGNAGPGCALVWLTRSGIAQWHDDDARWTSPICAAWAELGRQAKFAVVTPRGWYSPTTGQGRTWRRAREHT